MIQNIFMLCDFVLVLVTSLPRDRLSQVTRRGMLTNTKSHMKIHTANHTEDHQVGYERKMQLNKRPSGGTAVGRGIQREQIKTEEMKRRKESNIVRIPYFITYFPFIFLCHYSDVTSMSSTSLLIDFTSSFTCRCIFIRF